MPPSQVVRTARAVLTRAVVHIPDLRPDPEYAHELSPATSASEAS